MQHHSAAGNHPVFLPGKRELPKLLKQRKFIKHTD